MGEGEMKVDDTLSNSNDLTESVQPSSNEDLETKPNTKTVIPEGSTVEKTQETNLCSENMDKSREGNKLKDLESNKIETEGANIEITANSSEVEKVEINNSPTSSSLKDNGSTERKKLDAVSKKVKAKKKK